RHQLRDAIIDHTGLTTWQQARRAVDEQMAKRPRDTPRGIALLRRRARRTRIRNNDGAPPGIERTVHEKPGPWSRIGSGWMDDRNRRFSAREQIHPRATFQVADCRAHAG